MFAIWSYFCNLLGSGLACTKPWCNLPWASPNVNLGGAPSELSTSLLTPSLISIAILRQVAVRDVSGVGIVLCMGKFCFVGPLQGGPWGALGRRLQGFALEKGRVPAVPIVAAADCGCFWLIMSDCAGFKAIWLCMN